MKKTIAVFAMIGNMGIVLVLLSTIEIAMQDNSPSPLLRFLGNFFVLCGTLIDITYINYIIWEAIT